MDFPTNSIVSLPYVMQDGSSAEITVVGNEGVGISLPVATNLESTANIFPFMCASVQSVPVQGLMIKSGGFSSSLPG